MESLSRCEDCYWRQTLTERVRLLKSALERSWSQDVLVAYAKSRSNRGMAKQTALRLDREIAFLGDLEGRIRQPENLRENQLLAFYGPGRLRHHLNLTRFLGEYFCWPARSKREWETSAVMHQVRAIAAGNGDDRVRETLEVYLEHLLLRLPPLRPRTIKSYLSAARSLLTTTASPPESPRALRLALTSLLQRRPGLHNTLRAYARFRGIDMPARAAPAAQAQQPMSPTTLRRLFDDATRASAPESSPSLAALIAALFDVPLPAVLRAQRSAFQPDIGVLTVGSESFTLPLPLTRSLDALRKDDERLFVGSRGYNGLKRGTVTQHLRRCYGCTFGDLRRFLRRDNIDELLAKS